MSETKDFTEVIEKMGPRTNAIFQLFRLGGSSYTVQVQ